ncbi:hypothetical protein BaRGS_00007655 [Batillaria attramentaria]|uniref:Death domain-containing protein n=1 Tax=Batillaria attramentaria TaxID=370345 RepID=A0ABD0LNS3_9CAEN
MLNQWRSSRSPRPDRGVSELLIALQKAGRHDLVTVALDRLRFWLTEHGITGGPMAALLEEKIPDHST